MKKYWVYYNMSLGSYDIYYGKTRPAEAVSGPYHTKRGALRALRARLSKRKK